MKHIAYITFSIAALLLIGNIPVTNFVYATSSNSQISSSIPTPTNLSVQSVDKIDAETIKATIAWDSPEQAFRIYSRSESENKPSPIGYTQSNPMELSFSALSPYYYISVSAVRKVGDSYVESAKTNEVKISWNRPKLSTPTSFRVDKTETVNSITKAYISWDPVEHAQKYIIYQTDNAQTKALGEIQNTSTFVSFPEYGNNIVLSVSAAYQYGESPKSQTIGISRTRANTPTSTKSTIPNVIPDKPENLRIISNSIKGDKREIEIGWDHSENAQGYTVLIAVQGAYQPISSVNTNRAIVNAPAVFDGFKIAVVAYNIRGTSDESNEITIQSTKNYHVTVPTQKIAITLSPTPPLTTQEQDVIKLFSIEEQPETQETIVVGSNEEPTNEPSPTSAPEESENSTVQKQSFIERAVEFFQNLWSQIFG